MNYAAAIDIGGTAIKYGIVSNEGKIIVRRDIPTEAHMGGKALMQKVIQIVEELQMEQIKIDGIGVSTGGQISPETGEVLFATEVLPGWTGMKVKNILVDKFGLPVFVENDANAAALGEKWVGAAKSAKDFVFLIVGTGLGGAIVINSEVYKGAQGAAGELGHIVIDRSVNKKCTCGGKGCFEQWASMTALIDYTTERLGKGDNTKRLSGKDIFDRALLGNKICQEAIDWFTNNLGLGISNLIHIFNPQLIVIGGEITKQGEHLINKIIDKTKAYANKYSMISFTNDLKIKFASLGNDAGMIGAAYGVFVNSGIINEQKRKAH